MAEAWHWSVGVAAVVRARGYIPFGHHPLPSRSDRRVWAYLLPLVAATIVFAPTSTLSFNTDDYVIVGELEGFSPWMGGPLDLWKASSGHSEDVRRAIDLGHLPWWTS
jgi:hypothetical protein